MASEKKKGEIWLLWIRRIFLCSRSETRPTTKPRYRYWKDWRLSASDRGRRRLLFFHGPEFYCLEDLPEGLLEIRDGFQAVNFELETALSNLDKEDAMEKEAA